MAFAFPATPDFDEARFALKAAGVLWQMPNARSSFAMTTRGSPDPLNDNRDNQNMF